MVSDGLNTRALTVIAVVHSAGLKETREVRADGQIESGRLGNVASALCAERIEPQARRYNGKREGLRPQRGKMLDVL